MLIWQGMVSDTLKKLEYIVQFEGLSSCFGKGECLIYLAYACSP